MQKDSENSECNGGGGAKNDDSKKGKEMEKERESTSSAPVFPSKFSAVVAPVATVGVDNKQKHTLCKVPA